MGFRGRLGHPVHVAGITSKAAHMRRTWRPASLAAVRAAVVAAFVRHATFRAAVLALSATVGVLTAGTALAMPTSSPTNGVRPVAPIAEATGSAVKMAAVRTAGGMPRELIVPDLIAALPSSITAAQVKAVRRLAGVRAVLAVSGGGIKINGHPVTALGAAANALRAWTPPVTAADTALWAGFGRGDLVPSAAASKSLRLRAGVGYTVTAAVRTTAVAGRAAQLGVPGIDVVVSDKRAAQLGLVKNAGLLINAPGANLITLAAKVRSLLGKRGQVIRLVPVSVPDTSLPVDTTVPTGTPTNWTALYQESAKLFCPGLSWTVLAAIGEIESGNGANEGPSSAGALGPMQFLPSTWAVWGIDAFGQTGPPNIMDPLDAVPSAARMLCADGAGNGGSSLAEAIFDYNHAGWYVTEVLDLAAEYAREYG
jgi:hypothetical protein